MFPVSLAGGMSRTGGYVKGMGIFGEGGEERGGGVGIPVPSRQGPRILPTSTDT